MTDPHLSRLADGVGGYGGTLRVPGGERIHEPTAASRWRSQARFPAQTAGAAAAQPLTVSASVLRCRLGGSP